MSVVSPGSDRPASAPLALADVDASRSPTPPSPLTPVADQLWPVEFSVAPEDVHPLPPPRRPSPPAPPPFTAQLAALAGTATYLPDGALDASGSSPVEDRSWVRHGKGNATSAASGARWAFTGLGIRSVVGGLGAFVIARFVGPEVYGVMGLGLTYSVISGLVMDQGMGQALIRKSGLRRADVATMNAFTIGIAVVVGLLTIASSGFWQSFFHSPGLGQLLFFLGAGLILKTPGLSGQAVLMRDGQFRWLAGCDIVSAITSTTASLTIASMTGSAIALAAQILVNDGVYSIGVAVRSGAPLRGANRQSLREMLGFTLKISGSLFLGFAGRNADNVLIGRVLGRQALAYYLVSYRFMMLPIQNLTMVANRVLYPTYARIQDDLPRFRAAFLKTCALMSLVATPLMAVLIVFSKPLISGFLGNTWGPAVFPTQVLAFVAIVQVQTSLITPPIVAFGRSGWQLIWTLAYTILTVTLFAITVHWGIDAVCIGYAIVNLVTLPMPIRLVGKLGGFRLRDFARSIAPGLALGCAVAGVGFVVRVLLSHVGALPDVVVALGGGGLTLAMSFGLFAVLSPATVKQLRALR